MTGKTRGNTTDPSAKYWYKTRVSFSFDVYLTSVANTVNTSACVDRSGMTSGSSKTFDSFDTDDREPRSYIYRKITSVSNYFVLSCKYFNYSIFFVQKIRQSHLFRNSKFLCMLEII